MTNGYPCDVLHCSAHPWPYKFCGLVISAQMAKCLLSAQIPERVELVDKAGLHGVVLLTKNLAVKLVKLAFLITKKVPVPLSVATVVQTGMSEPPTAILFTDEPLGVRGETPDHVPGPTTPAAVPLEVQYRSETKLVYYPTHADIEGACTGEWLELPWEAADYSIPLRSMPKFCEELNSTKLAASIGVSPAFHGACIVFDAGKRFRYCNGLLLSCAWLHDTIRQHLDARSSNPVGIIVTRRCELTLGRSQLNPERARRLLGSAKILQKQLDSCFSVALMHGLLHLDIHANNIGLSRDINGQLVVQLIDWNHASNQICLSRLPQARHPEMIVKCIMQLTEGVVEDALVTAMRPQIMYDSSARILTW